MKYSIAFIFLICILSCSPKIHQHFQANRLVKDFNIHVINDSLQLYFQSPADIDYVEDQKILSIILRKQNVRTNEEILIFGQSSYPHYDFYLTVDTSSQTHPTNNWWKTDTIINGYSIRLYGRTLVEDAMRNMQADLKFIRNSLEIGPNYRRDVSTVMDVVAKYSKSNAFLGALNEIKKFPVYDDQEEGIQRQMILTYSSFLGQNEIYKDAIGELDARFEPFPSIIQVVENHSLEGKEAIDKIFREAADRQLLMINENHYYPNHRLFVSDLLEELKSLGYHYLALEALDWGQDSLLNLEKGMPTLNSGFYIREQHFANLIRKAKALGFEFVAYENFNSDTDREIGQAENLFAKTFALDPNSKVLVLAGVDHILEEKDKGKEWLASIFKKKYGIDPLTISQTHLQFYRSYCKADYGLIKSDEFENERLNKVDYLLLNNRESVDFDSKEYFQNKTDGALQVMLFIEEEMTDRSDFRGNVPYFSAMLGPKEKCQLPSESEYALHLIVLNDKGRLLEQRDKEEKNANE
ncbi:MAG: hypothetical protein AAF487_00505 [Bacteroidota bacterium]